MNAKMDNMARKLAWTFAFSNGESFDDLYSEAQVALLEAAPKYDPTRASWSTFAHRAISNRLCDAVRKWRTGSGCVPKGYNVLLKPIEVELDDKDGFDIEHNVHWTERPHPEPYPYHIVELKSSLSILSAEAKDVLRIVLQAPGELMAMGQRETPTRLRQGLKRSLRDRGWTEKQIRKAFEEIKKAL